MESVYEASAAAKFCASKTSLIRFQCKIYIPVLQSILHNSTPSVVNQIVTPSTIYFEVFIILYGLIYTMCWNPEVSLSTFILACAGIIIGQINGLHNTAWSMFYLTIASMQLIEYFIWTHGLHKQHLNKALSALGLLTVFLQPLAAGLLISKSSYQIVYFGMYLLWACIYAAIVPTVLKTTIAPNAHLAWKWLNPPVAFIVTWTAFLVAAMYLSSMTRTEFVCISIFVVLLTSVSYYFYKSYEGAWGSVYCSFVNIIFVVILFKAFFKQYCNVGWGGAAK